MPVDPPELPALPPIRESAEHTLPPEGEAQPREAVQEQRVRRGAARTVTRRQPRARERRHAEGGRRGEDGRHLRSAGHGLVVAALALVFAALLTAPGMHKTAFNGDPGIRRDVSLALTGALAGVSNALLLDRPRALAQDMIGRENADRINVAVVAPVTTAPRPTGKDATAAPVAKPTTKPAAPSAPAKIVFTPKKKLKLWVAGDSLVITPGYAIVRAAGGSPVIQSVGGVDGHVATGLTRPDIFNWFEQIAARVKELKPNVVVLNFGGNDDHAYMTGLPEGASIGEFGGTTWTDEYRRRVRIVMDTVNKAGGLVVWIGLPITNNEAQTQRFDTLNAIVQKIAKKRPGRAIFIDTYTMFAGDDGGFTEFMDNDRGDNVKVRAGDGVHFDVAGGDMIAREVLRQLNKLYDLTSWRRQETS